uniref:Uncharacterized protein n=1 Tax=Arundo donax TaxID=35708 RepID=A0A0A8YNI1_ARUDO
MHLVLFVAVLFMPYSTSVFFLQIIYSCFDFFVCSTSL